MYYRWQSLSLWRFVLGCDERECLIATLEIPHTTVSVPIGGPFYLGSIYDPSSHSVGLLFTSYGPQYGSEINNYALFAADEALYKLKYGTCVQKTTSTCKRSPGLERRTWLHTKCLQPFTTLRHPPHPRPLEAGAQAGCEAVVVGAEAVRSFDSH